MDIKSTEEYIAYLFYSLADDYKKEFASSIEAVPQLLHLLGKEFFHKKEIYNSFKHGALIFPGDLKLFKGNAKGEEVPLIKAIPTFMVLPKDGKKKSKFFPRTDRMEYSTEFMSKMDIYNLNYLRPLNIFSLTMALIRNLIQIRRDTIGGNVENSVVTLPKLDEINRIFEEPPLFTIQKSDNNAKGETNKNDV